MQLAAMLTNAAPCHRGFVSAHSSVPSQSVRKEFWNFWELLRSTTAVQVGSAPARLQAVLDR